MLFVKDSSSAKVLEEVLAIRTSKFIQFLCVYVAGGGPREIHKSTRANCVFHLADRRYFRDSEVGEGD